MLHQKLNEEIHSDYSDESGNDYEHDILYEALMKLLD